MRRLVSAAALLVASAIGAPASAAEGNRPDLAFRHGAAEVAIASVCAASTFTYFIDQRQTDWRPSRVQRPNPTADGWSDFFGATGGVFFQLGTGYLLESAYLERVGADDPGVEALHGSLVEAEAVFLSTGMTFLGKRLSGRCRPRAVEGDRCTEFDAFPSGHTSAITPYAGARLVRLATTPGDGIEFRAANYAIAEASALTAAFLRVAAGAHSWEDVLVGGLLGHASGVLLALAHPPVDVVSSGHRSTSAAARSRVTSFTMTFDF